jgi:hypothetical protein
MDGFQFDSLTRVAAAAPSRRALVSAMIGGLAALAFGGRAGAAARKRPVGEICRKAGDCVSGVCSGPDATGRSRCGCPATEVALDGRCFLAYPNCSGDCPAFAVVVSGGGVNACLPVADLGSASPCDTTAECPSDEVCVNISGSAICQTGCYAGGILA